jgi:hypothetical protein
MKNIFRTEKKGKGNYTGIANDILQSKTLKPDEVRILVYLLSLPVEFEIHLTIIWNQIPGMGRVKFQKSWKKLEQFGYINTIKYIKDPVKKTFDYRHIVYETPQVESNNLLLSNSNNRILKTGIQINNHLCTRNRTTGTGRYRKEEYKKNLGGTLGGTLDPDVPPCVPPVEK